MNITLKILIILFFSVFLGVMVFYIRRTEKVENKKSLWISGKLYKSGHIVVLELGGIEYKCKVEHTSDDGNKPGVDSTKWETLSDESYVLNVQVKEEEETCDAYSTYNINLHNEENIITIKPTQNDFFKINKCVSIVWNSPIPVTETYIVKMVGNTNMPSITDDIIDKYEFVDNKVTINFDTSQTFTYIIYQPDIKEIEEPIDLEYYDIITYYDKYKDTNIKGKITVVDSL